MGILQKSAQKKPGRVAVQARATQRAPARSSLVDALFTSTQQRILALLFGKPDRSFFATEIIQLAKSGTGAVQRELLRLEASGLVVVTRVGNQKHFQANRAAPIFAELRSIVLKTLGLVDPLRAVLEPFGGLIDLAIVYGSVAKRTDTASSDVDLLIVSDGLTLERLYAALAVVEREIVRKINVTLYTSREYQQRRDEGHAFLSKVLAGEHWVLMGTIHGGGTAR
jgi:predicted nucleotidyltransferase